ncbi:MAG TPA: hypothetical protein VN724_13990 [Pyrinomonadaceae bacterium]|jgi:hypothetical protein|nr:hypothetical protein [Pyrinomonadaceae bacterium]
MKPVSTFRRLMILALQAGLIFVLVGAAWMIYRQLPAGAAQTDSVQRTTLQILIKQTPDSVGQSLDVAVSLYPVDIIAVRHEFFTETRPGKRFEDFLKERMKGRSPVNARLDKQGSGSVSLPPGSWWLHATLSGDEQLEWRLPVTVTGTKQVIELTPQNAYTRSKTF